MKQAPAPIAIPPNEIDISAVRASGAGGQNVNKVSSAIHLRFDIRASSLPEPVKRRLLDMHDKRISRDGVIIIKAQQHRSQDQNREEAIQRLQTLVRTASVKPKTRKPTKPTHGSKQRRLDSKRRHAQLKAQRRKVSE